MNFVLVLILVNTYSGMSTMTSIEFLDAASCHKAFKSIIVPSGTNKTSTCIKIITGEANLIK